MEENYGFRGRRLRRGHEYNRLEEDLWALAYDRVLPVLRRSLGPPPSLSQDDRREDVGVSTRIVVGG